MRLKERVKEIPLERPKGVSEEQWEKAIKLYKTAKKMGDVYPELTVAQAALETGWFKSPSGDYNYFGQKATSSQEGSVVTTHEYSGNNKYQIKDKFRDYSSIEEAMQDRLNKWGSKYKDADSVREALYSIWEYDEERGMGTGYATDVKYDDKIFTILGMMGQEVKNLKEQDSNIYGMDSKGQIVTINPEKATELEKRTSGLYKDIVYSKPLTSFEVTPKKATFVPDWKQKLKQKIQKRQKIQGFIQQGGLDYIAPERKPSNAAQMIQQSYMENGGQIPVSSNGLLDFPSQMVIVPVTNGRVTMKKISYPVLGIADTGEHILMQPDKEYEFKGAKTVLEIPQL